MTAADWLRLESASVWGVFGAVFLAFALWETLQPAKPARASTGKRWAVHGALFTLGSLLGTLLLRTSPMLMALEVVDAPWGLRRVLGMPAWLSTVVTVLVLDAWSYAAHALLHRVWWLWRLHRMHHSDPDYDASTATRSHPLELLMVRGGQLAWIAFLAPPPVAVLTFELAATVVNFLAHANVSLPPGLERMLRPVIFTPDVHRIHHSMRREEQWTNFGQIFPWWDLLLGTYRSEPQGGRANLQTGLPATGQDALDLGAMLWQPFRSKRR